jgi:hypothetical protein
MRETCDEVADGPLASHRNLEGPVHTRTSVEKVAIAIRVKRCAKKSWWPTSELRCDSRRVWFLEDRMHGKTMPGACGACGAEHAALPLDESLRISMIVFEWPWPFPIICLSI